MTTACATYPAAPRLDAVTLGAVTITVFGWASAFPAIGAGLTGFGPLELGALRFGLAALPATVLLLVTRPALPPWRQAWRFAFGGLVFVALYTVLLNVGQQTVPAGAASFIINVNPILTAGLAMLVLGERFGLYAWLGTALSFAGIGLIAMGKTDDLQLDAGALLILGAALCTALTSIVQKPLFARHKPQTVAAVNIIVGALALSPFLPSSIAQAQTAPAEALFAAIYLAVIPSFLVYGTWAVALSRLPAARATNFLYCVPPLATLMGWLWLDEVPTLFGIIGGTLALGGVVLVNVKR